MREIKFRAKTTSEVWGGNQVKDGTWVYGFYRDKVGLPVISQFEIDRGDYIDYEIDRNTLGQFTGFYDKYGNEIYEGDIVKFSNLEYRVVFTCGAFILVIDKEILYKDFEKNKKIFYKEIEKEDEETTNNDYTGNHYVDYVPLIDNYWNFHCEDDVKYLSYIKVIGNIYDNKELLGE